MEKLWLKILCCCCVQVMYSWIPENNDRIKGHCIQQVHNPGEITPDRAKRLLALGALRVKSLIARMQEADLQNQADQDEPK